MAQLDLFEDENEISILKNQIKFIQKEMYKIKRSNQKHYQKIMKLCVELNEENERLRAQFAALTKKQSLNDATDNSDLLQKLFAEAYNL